MEPKIGDFSGFVPLKSTSPTGS